MKPILLKTNGDTYIPLADISYVNIRKALSFGMSLDQTYELYARTIDGQTHLLIGGCKNIERLEEVIKGLYKDHDLIEISLKEEEIMLLEEEERRKKIEEDEEFVKVVKETLDSKNSIELETIDPDKLQKEIEDKFKANRTKGRKKKTGDLNG